jgi:hypothetical protein
MKRAAAEALVERNAAACEAARTSRCKCACGGKLHGVLHSKAWQSEQVEKIADQPDPAQLALDSHFTRGTV